MKVHIFLVANPKFQLQIVCSFGDMTKNVKFIGIPENNFLCIFIIASSPGVHTFFCLWRVNKKLPQGETSQNAFQRSRSINLKWKIYMSKWAYPPLRFETTLNKTLHENIIMWLLFTTFYSPVCLEVVVLILFPQQIKSQEIDTQKLQNSQHSIFVKSASLVGKLLLRRS